MLVLHVFLRVYATWVLQEKKITYGMVEYGK